jgi:hypothetical protein
LSRNPPAGSRSFGQALPSLSLRCRQAELKVLFITGYSRDAVVHQGRLDSGVSKLLSQTLLAARISDILDQR